MSGAACYKACCVSRPSQSTRRKGERPGRTELIGGRAIVSNVGGEVDRKRERAGAGKGEREEQNKARLARTKVGWNKALWAKHLWSKNRRSRSKKIRSAGSDSRTKLSRRSRASWNDNEAYGGCKSNAKGKRPLNLVLNQAKDERWRVRAKAKFLTKFYASSTWASKDSKRRRLAEIATAVGLQLTPVNGETIVDVATVLDEAKLQAADQYLAELKWLHIEENYKWDEALERRLTQCKRALKRDSRLWTREESSRGEAERAGRRTMVEEG